MDWREKMAIFAVEDWDMPDAGRISKIPTTVDSSRPAGGSPWRILLDHVKKGKHDYRDGDGEEEGKTIA